MSVTFVQFGQGIIMDLVRLCGWLVVLTAIFVPLERLFALHREKLFRPQIVVDLGYYFLNGLLPIMLISLPLGLLGWLVHRWMPAAFLSLMAGLPLWCRMVLGLLVGDIGYYWAHRLLHGVPWLWRFHAVHHSAPHIDFLINTRAHPIDMAFGRMCGLIPLYVLGLTGPIGADAGVLPTLVLLAGVIWGFFVHANLRWDFGPLAWLLSTPRFHHWHHAIEAPLNHNYASMLPCIDRVFGTLHMPKGVWPARYGIAEPMPASLTEQLLLPFMDPRAQASAVGSAAPAASPGMPNAAG